jgi:hypothetical protein
MCSIQKPPTINNLLTYSSPNEAMPLLFQGLKAGRTQYRAKPPKNRGFRQQIETKFTRTGFAAMPHWDYPESVAQAKSQQPAGPPGEPSAPLTKKGEYRETAVDFRTSDRVHLARRRHDQLFATGCAVLDSAFSPMLPGACRINNILFLQPGLGAHYSCALPPRRISTLNFCRKPAGLLAGSQAQRLFF